MAGTLWLIWKAGSMSWLSRWPSFTGKSSFFFKCLGTATLGPTVLNHSITMHWIAVILCEVGDWVQVTVAKTEDNLLWKSVLKCLHSYPLCILTCSLSREDRDGDSLTAETSPSPQEYTREHRSVERRWPAFREDGSKETKCGRCVLHGLQAHGWHQKGIRMVQIYMLFGRDQGMGDC